MTLWLGLGTMVFLIVARKHALMFVIPLVIALLFRVLLQHVYHPG